MVFPDVAGTDVLLWVFVFVTVTGFLLRGIWKVFVVASDAYQRLKLLSDTLTPDTVAQIAEIHHQLTPNDGESVKDLIDRADENDRVLWRNLDRVYGELLHGRKIDPAHVPPLEHLVDKEERVRRRHQG